ncbi:intracellular hyaluronan-binding protein 4 isoform X1 [Hoplias malabaricus]|uniref:intracellular hyaluronan-binding protein 4 isoform X1 n=1 Tax=Hoplias malabaricus TaxID=27720 RepID=UPI0034634361
MKDLVEKPPDPGFSCTVANRFGNLLDNEADPFDLLCQSRVQQEKKKKVESKKSSSPRAKKEESSQRDRKAAPRAADEGGGATNLKAAEGQRRPVRAQQEERVEKRVSFTEPKYTEGEDFQGFSFERPTDVYGAGRGIGRGRGARGVGYPRSTDGFNLRGKREFERHSGSDRVSVRPGEKRGGSGPRNWGSMQDHVNAVAEVLSNEERTENEAQESTEAEGENPPPETEEMIEVAIEMTLDEWKAVQEQNRSKAEFNIRKADTKMPSKALVIHKSKHVEMHSNGPHEDDLLSVRRPANDITFQMDINFGSLARPSRGGRGGRGGRGRGAPPAQRLPERSAEVAPDPDDPEDFPALA